MFNTSLNQEKVVGTLVNKEDGLYVRYVQQYDGYVINTYEIELDPKDAKLNLREGQTVQFDMVYGQMPTGKNYAKIKNK